MLHPSSAGLPSVSEISAAVLASLSSPDAQEPSSTSEALVALSALHGRELSKALLLLERRAVSLFEGEPSGRRSASVAAGGGGGGPSGAAAAAHDHHHHRHATLAPHFCSCESFFFDVVGRGEKPACKHLIAAQVAEALAEKEKAEKGKAASSKREGGGERGRQGQQQQQQQLPSPSSVSPLAAFAPAPTLVPDDVLARLLIAG